MQPERKRMRLTGHDYNTPGEYFITLCTKDKRCILGDVVGTGVLDGPHTKLSAWGKVAEKWLLSMADFYDDVKLEHYVIMPNHIHLLLRIPESVVESGPPGRSVPTHNRVSAFVGTFKRMCNRDWGESLWQSRSYDHIVRGEKDHRDIWEYISNNPAKWAEDRLFR